MQPVPEADGPAADRLDWSALSPLLEHPKPTQRLPGGVAMHAHSTAGTSFALPVSVDSGAPHFNLPGVFLLQFLWAPAAGKP
jgi:hypothetical protein